MALAIGASTIIVDENDGWSKCLQVFASHTCYLFDMLQINEDVLDYLKAILEDENVTKVIHDCRQDSAALFYQFGIKLHNIFDTQVCGLALVCIAEAVHISHISCVLCHLS